MYAKRIQSALISVYNKQGLDDIVRLMGDMGIVIYSTGGTKEYIESLGVSVVAVENVTDYPSILGGRVKTLHPKIFGGILAMRTDDHLSQLAHFEIPLIDLVVVDLYPFEQVANTGADDAEVIEKIDIGGISLIRAAAKNYRDVVVIPGQGFYANLMEIIRSNGITDLAMRKKLAVEAFAQSSRYDHVIYQHLGGLKRSLRYGENPHQEAYFSGRLEDFFEVQGGKDLSYNNILDMDAATQLMAECKNEDPCFAIIKHTNVCGFALRPSLTEAWRAALAGDPISAFGGVLICNRKVDLPTARQINEIFYELLLAPDFDPEVLEFLLNKKNRILIRIKDWPMTQWQMRTALNGALYQQPDLHKTKPEQLKTVTRKSATAAEMVDLTWAAILAKHLKSNAITLVKERQLVGMGCGQTSRVDACRQAIEKAKKLGFNLNGAVLASEAFFPFPDCVELAAEAGITAIAQPGGSVNDAKSIDRANELNLAMVFSGVRHFKH